MSSHGKRLSAPTFSLVAALVLVSCGGNGSSRQGGGGAPPGAVDPDASFLTASPGEGALADGWDAVSVVVWVRDAGGEPVAGKTVVLHASGTGNVLTQPAAKTDAEGRAVGTLATTAAELKTLSAVVDPGPFEVALTSSAQTGFVWPTPANYYVRESGSDASSGKSPAQAWRTIGQAAASVTAGDTVFIGAGTYREEVSISVTGTAAAPIAFVADTAGDRTGDAGPVVVDGGGAHQTFHLDGADHVRIEGFTVLGAGAGGGVNVGGTPSTGVVIRGNTLYDNALGIGVSAGSGTVVESNRISSGSGDGIQVTGATGVTLRNNLVYDNAGRGILVTGASTGVVVELNTLYLNAGDQVHVDGSGNDVLVRENVIAFGLADGIELVAGSTAASSYNVLWASSGHSWLGLTAGTGDLVADPLLVCPFGPDNLLGGAQGADDGFQLDPQSPALDAGSARADSLVLSDGSSLADCTTRVDSLRDGTLPDGATANVGFHYGVPGERLPTLEPGDVRLAFGRGRERDVVTRARDDSLALWLGERDTPALGAPIASVLTRISPLQSSEEFVAIASDTGGGVELDLLRWTGRAWDVEWSSAGIASANVDKRGFDLEFEGASAELLAVYSIGSDTPVYRTRVAGTWGPELSLPLNDGAGDDPDPNAGTVLWVELEARPGTDEVAVVYVDDAATLVAMVWDGAAWDTSTAITLEATVASPIGVTAIQNRAFDLAYETTTGDLLVAWAQEGSAGFAWSEKPAGSSVWSAPALQTGGPSQEPHFVDLSPDPASARVAGGFFDLGEGAETLGLAIWNGASWADVGTYDTQMRNVNGTATGDFFGAVGWAGTSGTAVCVYPDTTSNTLDWAAWTVWTGWSIRPDVIIPGKDFTESMQLETIPGGDRLMAAFSDRDSYVFVAILDASGWTVTNQGQAAGSRLSTLSSRPFDLAVRR